MLANNQASSADDQLEDLLGGPPLLKGEDIKRYWRLHAAIGHEINPVTVFDKIRVREITDKLWQQQRCKQSAASLIEGAYIEALASSLRPFSVPTIISLGEDAASEMARDYYSETNPEKVKMVGSLLALYSITSEQIRAKAMQLCGTGISMFYRMETDCETSLRTLQKDNDRRLAAENRKPRGSAQPVAG